MSRRLLLWLLFPKWNSNESSRKSESLWISCIFLVKIAICNRMANYLGLCVGSVCSGRQKVTGKWGDYLRLWHMPRGLLSAANIRLNTIQKLNWIGQGEARHPPFCPQFILCRPLALKSCQILLHTHTHSLQRGKMEMQMRISNLNSNTKSNRNPKSVCIVYNDHILPVCPLFFLFICLLPCCATASPSSSLSSSPPSSWSLLHLCSILFLSPFRLDCRFSCNFCISRFSQSCTYLRQTLVYPAGCLRRGGTHKFTWREGNYTEWRKFLTKSQIEMSKRSCIFYNYMKIKTYLANCWAPL